MVTLRGRTWTLLEKHEVSLCLNSYLQMLDPDAEMLILDHFEEYNINMI